MLVEVTDAVLEMARSPARRCLVQVRRIPGANLLQVTWEHMTLLPAAVLERLRDSLLRFLGQSAQCTAPVQEVDEIYGAAAAELLVSLSKLRASPWTNDAHCHSCHLGFAARDAGFNKPRSKAGKLLLLGLADLHASPLLTHWQRLSLALLIRLSW